MGKPANKTACRRVLAKLAQHADAKVRAGMERFGVYVEHARGIPTPVLRRLAREIGTDHELAQQLWDSGIHEARALAAMVDDPKQVTEAQMERWARDFNSWDIVDGSCCHLFAFARPAWKKAVEWAHRDGEYVRRAGFALMAYLAYKDKQAPDAKYERLFPLIRRYATDNRNFVKKAVNWALRNIGKRNPRLNRKAIALAKEMRRMNSPVTRWIASDALRELQSPAVQRRLRREARS